MPQGSNLDPLLLLMFLNDISKTTTVPFQIFADDFKILSRVTDNTQCHRFGCNF